MEERGPNKTMDSKEWIAHLVLTYDYQPNEDLEATLEEKDTRLRDFEREARPGDGLRLVADKLSAEVRLAADAILKELRK